MFQWTDSGAVRNIYRDEHLRDESLCKHLLTLIPVWNAARHALITFVKYFRMPATFQTFPEVFFREKKKFYEFGEGRQG